MPLWSERFDRKLEDVFAVQDDISLAIVNKLGLSIGQRQRRYDTEIEQVTDRYLRARGLLETRQIGEEAREAARLLEDVVARDPAFAHAHAGLATAYAYMSNNPYFGRSSTRPARVCARRRSGRCSSIRCWPKRTQRWAGCTRASSTGRTPCGRSSGRSSSIARSRRSRSTTSYSTLRALGKLDYAERLLREALRHDPLSWPAERELASVLLQAGRYQQAIDITQRFRAADQTTVDIYVDRDLARALTFTGRYEEAIAVLTSARFAGPGQEHWRALPYVRTGRRDAVEQLAIAHKGYPFRLAFIYAALDDRQPRPRGTRADVRGRAAAGWRWR